MSAATMEEQVTTGGVRSSASVRVNLLPEATKQRGRESRQRTVAVSGLVAVVAMLGAGYWYQLQRVDDAAQQRDLAAEAVSLRSAEVAELAAYADLQSRVDQADGALTTALGDEISVAGVMQDIAFVTPPDTALTGIDITVVEDVVGIDGQQVQPSLARLQVSGETLARHAPGVEGVLREFDKLQWFFDPYLSHAEVDQEDPDILVFQFEVDLDESALTGRYVDGLPEALR